MFSSEQIQSLSLELSSHRIKSRLKGNINLSYLEGFDVIETANTIFGYGNWSYKIITLEQVSEESNQNDNIVVCYKAVVSIIIHDTEHTKQISREDVGFGIGIAKTFADAHESAAKEAVTDALKRAFRSFGNQFGNSLYDKSRNMANNQLVHQSGSINNRVQTPQNAKSNFNNTNRSSWQSGQNSQPNESKQDYAKLFNLGLTIIEQGDKLVVFGDDIFAKRDTIKSCGFHWDAKSKLWFKANNQKAA